MTRITCPKCAATRSQGAAHCMACHRSFTSVSAFDSHHRGAMCAMPGDKWRQRKDGAWTDSAEWQGPTA